MLTDSAKLNRIRELVFTVCLCMDSCDYAITELLELEEAEDLKLEIEEVKKATDAFISKMDASLSDSYKNKIGNTFDVYYKDVLRKFVKKSCK